VFKGGRKTRRVHKLILKTKKSNNLHIDYALIIMDNINCF
jgi:hypothetical protein